jgi:amino-acid N-acetyltransferase
MSARVVFRPATEQDAEPIRSLLEGCSLPTADLSRSRPEFIVACEGNVMLGAGALERFGATGLLRSLAVSPDRRGQGLGESLVAHLERRAFAGGLTELVLLTETARPFFERQGYRVIERAQAPAAVHGSEEFRSLCPQSACCMTKRL